MREIKDGLQCDLVFGKDSKAARETMMLSSDIDPDMVYDVLCNPLPTGDHWKVIEWVQAYIKKGPASLSKVPQARRDFIKRAAASLTQGPLKGFCMELSSVAARKFRDDNDLRMVRGKVYVFVGNCVNVCVDVGVKDAC